MVREQVEQRIQEATRIVHMNQSFVDPVDPEERVVLLTEEMKAMLRLPYALRHVPVSKICSLVP